MITILDKLEWKDEYPILAHENYLRSQNGVERIGYFVEDALVLPFIIKRKSIFSWMQLVTEVIGAETVFEEKDFLDRCVTMAKNIFNVCHISTTNTALFRSYPNDSKYCKWGSYKVDLTQSQDELFSALHSKHRNVIRKAESLGTVVEFGEQYAEAAVSLMAETYGRQKGKHGIETDYAHRMKKMGDNVDWWVVKDAEGHLQGSAIFVWSGGASSYYLHGGSSSHTSQGAMNLLIWRSMLEMKTRGVKCFDFVGARLTTAAGSKFEGIQRFKSRFGATLDEGYMFRYICKPFKYFLYTVAMKAYFMFHGEKCSDIIVEERKKGNV